MTSETKISVDTAVVASERQASADLGAEAAILSLDHGIYSGGAPSGRRFRVLFKNHEESELRDILVAEHEVDRSRCDDDLLTLLDQLAEKGLIDIVDDTPSSFFRLPPLERFLLIKACFVLAGIRVLLFLLPFPHFQAVSARIQSAMEIKHTTPIPSTA